MKIGVVILNYNNWQDTLLCAESVLASSVEPAWVVIVDNASSNNSVHRIRQWAAGENVLPDHGESSALPEAFTLVEMNEGQAADVPTGRLVLMKNRTNKGYAAGNNVGIRLLMRWGADAICLLNNDTIVDKNALGAMAERLFSQSRPGLCGARIQYFGTELLQCRAGGQTNPWTGLSRLDGQKAPAHESLRDTPEVVERRINFIYGACVMASRKFLEVTGLMDERFFLYCEEQDWAYSAKGRFDLAYAPDALVFHKEGGATGFSHSKFKMFVVWHLVRSRVLLTAKHVPWALPTVCLCIVFAALRMAWRRIINRLR